MFSGKAQLLPAATSYTAYTHVTINRNVKALNLTIQDTVDANYVTQVGTYTDISSGAKYVVVDANTAYFTVNTTYFNVVF